MEKVQQEALTFDDVLVIPKHSDVLPKDVSLKTKFTKNIFLNLPFCSAAMDTVTESKMAIALASLGGIGIIHKNCSPSEQAEQVKKVKKFESGIVRDPITIESSNTIAELIQLTSELNISGMPVVDNGDLKGIVTRRDFRNARNTEQSVKSIMTSKEKLITVTEGEDQETVKSLMYKHRIEKILVLDKQENLVGLITMKDIEKSIDYPLASRDSEGRLIVGAAVGVSKNLDERAKKLSSAGVDVFVIDSAHGDSKGVVDVLKSLKKQYPSIDVVAGNVATKEGAQLLIDAGADAIKVGVGPGSICTTRIIAGIGVPQLSAVLEVRKACKSIPIISDGGIRFSGDVVKAIGAGADSVMLGSAFAGTEEAPGEVELYQGRSFKTYRGMGSISAMAKMTDASRYMHGDDVDADKMVPEGIEGRVPFRGWLKDVVFQMEGGLRQGMGYTGSETILNLKERVQFQKITSSGVKESHVHDVSITKEAPNYRAD
ncbi:MAG: IMP dehydrogenase [Gammaproteobacteria bacterium]|uniref:Inosine-5'-monophosphate dehydrogenase n=1 Tax=SAR86 cluster bacterium TaxID=2030880 RepID=A0A520MZD5_9GAMM|nr:MAG: IMP dehydrogenase [SAR86 cluster bacterium]|tara:strand:+ start:3813 stop:5273 length:1461 start_codon:yes stop_codon:yes gene_type:complete